MDNIDLKSIIKDIKRYGRDKGEIGFSIACGVNEKFFPPLGIMLTSLVKNNPDRMIDIYIGTGSVSEEELSNLKEFVGQYPHVSVNLYYIDEAKLADYVGRENPTAAYYRVIMAEALQGYVDKLLYMDVDTLFLGKIEEFESIKFGSKTFWAVKDTLSGSSLSYHKSELGLSDKDGYFNSGVMYIDLDRWHNNDISNKVVQLLHERAVGLRKFMFMDQGALNLATVGLWGELHERFNYMIPVLREQYQGKILDNTVILHYAGPYKPWAYSSHEECVELSDNCAEMRLFDKYKKDCIWSGFAGYAKSHRTLRLISYWMFQKGEWLLAVKWYIKYLKAKFNR